MESLWFQSPHLDEDEQSICKPVDFPLLDPDNDCEIRKCIQVAKTSAAESHTPMLPRMQRFSSWRRLTRAITAIKMVGRCFKEKTTPSFVEMMKQTKHVLISIVQKDAFPSEIQCL